jgi:hypothetical protein
VLRVCRVLTVTVILLPNPQYKLESVIVDFFHSIYDDKPSEGRWDHYKQACEGTPTEAVAQAPLTTDGPLPDTHSLSHSLALMCGAASIKLLAMMTVAANNEALLSQFLPEMNKVVDGMLTSAAYEEGHEGEEPMPVRAPPRGASSQLSLI